MPRVAVIVSNFNGARFLPKLLQSLRGQVGVDLEIVVVDRQSRDESPTILASFPDVRVLTEPPETGLVSGYARGVPETTAELLFFCNEDMWFEPDCLARLAQHIDLPGRIGVVDPWQWTYDGRELIHAGVRFRATFCDLNSPFPGRAIEFLHPLAGGSRIPLPCAGAVLMHRAVYLELGGWDTSFFLNDEDTDLGVRAWAANWKIVTEPGAKVYHAVGASNQQTLTQLTQSVSERRYVSTYANKAIMGYKYFPARYRVLMAAQQWLRALNNLCKGRWRFLAWDGRVRQEIKVRRPAADRYRSAHPTIAGDQFFRWPEFQATRAQASTHGG